MIKTSPAIALSLIALCVALAADGFAKPRTAAGTVKVLGPTITVTRDLPAQQPRGWVMCPRGYQALGVGHDSWGGFEAYTNVIQVPAFWNGSTPDTFRDTGEGVERPVQGWYVAGTHAGSGDQPLKAVVICAKVVTLTR